jgi:hypothetical protein
MGGIAIHIASQGNPAVMSRQRSQQSALSHQHAGTGIRTAKASDKRPSSGIRTGEGEFLWVTPYWD